ncbi:hypothetical protein R69746_05645 [Paraburkholderia aspalathi]|uniref:hypothetical protein n=1 Tax=Paraburkholderia aspalathi TaxID=1324617 RepID=UPI00190D04C2|nr:hypothetical protein [Paraburkholderia aspalathi]MBK3841732.1 hypothetical protein [Paraburkholderia aspalathi]CAE6811582.1 hypothetical protein R69746_05645 [Paraburkholderia aspalathi]
MDDMTEAEQAMLYEWSRTAIDEALAANLVSMPFRPSAGFYDMLAGYYASGLTPAEAAQAAFGVHH